MKLSRTALRKPLALTAVGALIFAGALAASRLDAPAGSAPSALQPQPQTQTQLSQPSTALIELREVADIYAADAVIEAIRAATVSAQIAGNVTRFYVDAGDRVRRGQLLVRIDTRATDAQVAAGNAGVLQAEAQRAQAQIEHDRTAQLVAHQFVSQAALDKAKAELKTAHAAVAMARAGASQAATARTFAEVRAPIDGVVTRRLAELGELAAPGKPLLEVHDPSALRAVASVPQFVLPRIAQAKQADIIVPLLAASLAATRVTVLPAADARLLSTQVRADLPQQGAAGVVPGMAAKVLLVTGTAQRLVMPAEALVRRGELTAVYVVGADGQARLRQIRAGEAHTHGLIEVLAGLDAGERVQLNPLLVAR